MALSWIPLEKINVHSSESGIRHSIVLLRETMQARGLQRSKLDSTKTFGLHNKTTTN